MILPFLNFCVAAAPPAHVTPGELCCAQAVVVVDVGAASG